VRFRDRQKAKGPASCEFTGVSNEYRACWKLLEMSTFHGRYTGEISKSISNRANSYGRIT